MLICFILKINTRVNFFRSVSLEPNKSCLFCKTQSLIYLVVIYKALLVLKERDASGAKSTYPGG